jgi:hypothetical protein
MARPSHPPRLDYSNYTWQRVKITKLLVMQFSPFSHNIIPLRSNTTALGFPFVSIRSISFYISQRFLICTDIKCPHKQIQDVLEAGLQRQRHRNSSGLQIATTVSPLLTFSPFMFHVIMACLSSAKYKRTVVLTSVSGSCTSSRKPQLLKNIFFRSEKFLKGANHCSWWGGSYTVFISGVRLFSIQ